MSADLFAPFQLGDLTPALDDRGAVDLVAFGIPFLAFPDLERNDRQNLPLSTSKQPDPLRRGWAERCFS